MGCVWVWGMGGVCRYHDSSPISNCLSSGVGFTDGCVCVLDALTLEDVCPPFRYSRDVVTFIAFSHDSNYMATAVSDLLFLYCCVKYYIQSVVLATYMYVMCTIHTHTHTHTHTHSLTHTLSLSLSLFLSLTHTHSHTGP